MPSDDPTLGIASWCGQDHPVAAWVHRPAGGEVRGAVLIVPPMGRERTVAYRALRRLAIDIARSGRVAVRFTWSGQGESAPLTPGTAPAAAWHRDVAAAAALAREASGLRRVDAVGLRVGAALIAGHEDPELGVRVLWEPVSGSAFLRWQNRMRKLANPDVPTRADVVETVGEQFDLDVAQAIKRIEMPIAGSQTPVMTESPEDAALLYQSSPEQARVPLASIERLVATLPDDGSRAALPAWSPLREAMVRMSDGRAVLETLVDIGPHGLPGVLAVPVDVPPAGRTACIVAPGNEPKGSTTLWTATARRLAAAGVPALRFDRRTSGDREPAELLADLSPYTASAVEDTATGVSWLQEQQPGEVTGIGLCAAAWLLAAAAPGARLGRVVGFALAHWSTAVRPEGSPPPRNNPLPGVAAGDPQPAPAAPASVTARIREQIHGLLRGRVTTRKPFWLRYGFARLGLMDCAHVLLPRVARTTAIELYFATRDFGYFERVEGPESARRLARRGRSVTYRRVDDLDHGAQTASGEQRVLEFAEAALGLRIPPRIGEYASRKTVVSVSSAPSQARNSEQFSAGVTD